MIDLNAIKFRRTLDKESGETNIQAKLSIEANTRFSYAVGHITTDVQKEAERALRLAIFQQIYGELKEYVALVKADRALNSRKAQHIDFTKVIELEGHFNNILKGY